MNRRKPTHPGEVLFHDVIKPLNLTITETAKKLDVSRKSLSVLISGKVKLTTNMALRIAKATETSPESWLAMQTKLDLWNEYNSEPKNVYLLSPKLRENKSKINLKVSKV